MGMPTPATVWTAAMVRALPDDGLRHEVIDGVHLVTPAPRLLHQRAVFALMRRLHSYLAERRDAEVLHSPADIEFDELTLVQPDVFVIPYEAGRRPEQWEDVQTLLLAVEVLSPSTARFDRGLKRRRYQRAGIPEYWVVDLDARVVERWRPGDERPEVLDATLAWQPMPTEPPLTIDLPAYFVEVLGEP